MKKGKVVLVGTGFVGLSMAYSMLNRGGVNELILIDIDKDKTILVYCRSGKRATTAVEKLKRLGYTAYNMGGIANIDLPKE